MNTLGLILGQILIQRSYKGLQLNMKMYYRNEYRTNDYTYWSFAKPLKTIIGYESMYCEQPMVTNHI